MKILVLVNTLTSVQSQAYASHIEALVTAKVAYPEVTFILCTPHRMSIDRARNMAAANALSLDCDYLLFIDDDVVLPKNAIPLLLEADKDIVAGLVIIRGFPFHVMAFKKDDKGGLPHFDDLPKDEDGKLIELAECDAVGFSLCLIKIGVLKAMEPPYFITYPNMTEDVFFCGKAKTTLDPPPGIFVHTGIKCGHLMAPEPIEYDTIDLFKELHVGIQLREMEIMESLVGKSEENTVLRDKQHILRSLKQL
jgi:glycosyltransferase involved in cell wall biosynthesis